MDIESDQEHATTADNMDIESDQERVTTTEPDEIIQQHTARYTVNTAANDTESDAISKVNAPPVQSEEPSSKEQSAAPGSSTKPTTTEPDDIIQQPTVHYTVNTASNDTECNAISKVIASSVRSEEPSSKEQSAPPGTSKPNENQEPGNFKRVLSAPSGGVGCSRGGLLPKRVLSGPGGMLTNFGRHCAASFHKPRRRSVSITPSFSARNSSAAALYKVQREIGGRCN